MNKTPRRGWRGATVSLALLAAGSTAGCGQLFVAAGADIAAGGMKSGTQSVARGTSPSAGDAAGLAIGIGLMAAGYQLTEPDQRQQGAALMPASNFANATQPPPRP